MSCCSEGKCTAETSAPALGEDIDASFDKNGGVMKKILKHAPEDALCPPSGSSVTAHYVG